MLNIPIYELKHEVDNALGHLEVKRIGDECSDELYF